MRRRLLLLTLLGPLVFYASGCGGSGSNESSTAASPPATTASAGQTAYDSSNEDAYDESQNSQEDWDNQEGEAWDLFNESYLAGWEEGCDLVFDESPDGDLYDQGEQFTADDCYAAEPFDASESPDLPYDVPEDPEYEGNQLGMHDGCVAAFTDTVDDALFWGDEVALDESDCP
jgi:hypothetical protein